MLFPTAMPAALPACGANELAEGPVWDERLSRLYWVDITAGALRWLDAGAERRESLILGGTVGFVALMDEPDTVIVGHGRELKLLTLSSRSLELIASLEPAGATLFITTAAADLTTEQRERQPLAGAVFAVRPGVRGLRCDHFVGANRRLMR